MNKQVFFLLTALIVSGTVTAGRKTKSERKREEFAERKELRAAAAQSQSSFGSSADEKENSAAVVENAFLEEESFVNPNHTRPLGIDYSKQGKRFRKEQAKIEAHQARVAAASVKQGRI